MKDEIKKYLFDMREAANSIFDYHRICWIRKFQLKGK